MPGRDGHVTNQEVVEAVRAGVIDEAQLDRIVSDILRIVFMAHSGAREQDQNIEAHHALARRVAGESLVLLKNDGALLPLATDACKRVAVIGEFAQTPRYQGNGSSEVKPTRLDSAQDILRDEYGEVITSTTRPVTGSRMTTTFRVSRRRAAPPRLPMWRCCL